MFDAEPHPLPPPPNAQKKPLEASPKNTERVRQRRVDYWPSVSLYPPETLVFVDEAGVHLGMIRSQARSQAGTRAYAEAPLQRGGTISLIGGLSLRGMLALTPLHGAVDALTFEAFIAQRLKPQLRPGDCVVLDNARIHRESELLEILRPAQVSLLFLPPYSPEFSPIENAWSKLKECLRSLGARTHEQLLAGLDHANSTLSLQNIFPWFTHCCYSIADFDPSLLQPQSILIR